MINVYTHSLHKLQRKYALFVASQNLSLQILHQIISLFVASWLNRSIFLRSQSGVQWAYKICFWLGLLTSTWIEEVCNSL